jgi:hypothetical protein
MLASTSLAVSQSNQQSRLAAYRRVVNRIFIYDFSFGSVPPA